MDDSNEDIIGRRLKNDKKSKTQTALEKLKAQREGKKVEIELEDDEPMYDYVSTDGSISDDELTISKRKDKKVKSQLKNDNIEENDIKSKVKSNKNITKAKVSANHEDESKDSTPNIMESFARGAAKTRKKDQERQLVNKQEPTVDGEFLGTLLSELHKEAKEKKAKKRKTSPMSKPDTKRFGLAFADTSITPAVLHDDSNLSRNEFELIKIKEEKSTPTKQEITRPFQTAELMTPISDLKVKMEKAQIKDEPQVYDDDDKLLMNLDLNMDAVRASNDDFFNKNYAQCAPAKTTQELMITNANTQIDSKVSDDLPSDNLTVFWYDAYEDPYGSSAGTVYLFGKMQLPQKLDTYVSVCLQIKNVPRVLYVLPRKYRFNTKTRQETDEKVSVCDVSDEISRILFEKYRVNQVKSRKVEKYFAFDTHHDVPNYGEYLEIKYPAECAQLPSDLEGETFKCVFGTNTPFMETFLLELKLKGPTWLDIKQAKRREEQQQLSWSKVEYFLDDYRNISILKEQPASPPLVSLTFIIKTALNKSTQEHEIVLACGLVNQFFHLDKSQPTSSSLYNSYFCALSKPSNIVFPYDFNSVITNLQQKFKIEICSTERALLGYVLCKIHSIDPDIIIGHDLFGFNFDILLNRCVSKKVSHWSRLGHLKRNYVPKHISAQRIQTVCSGRILCDIMISAKELLTKCKNYELNELVSHVLKESLSIDNDEKNVYNYYINSENILKFIRLSMMEATYIYRICNDMNSVQLAYQITCIAGNILSRTLVGGRSERNEYLLLHAFYDKDFIVPEKHLTSYNKHKNLPQKATSSKSMLKEVTNFDDNDHTGVIKDDYEYDDDSKQVASGKKIAKTNHSYAGGLVLEPKIGFYDHFILLLDFNSLYPSIIQEYNICFTTINRPKPHEQLDLDDYLENSIRLPNASDKMGVLPLEIRKLVDSRKQVKTLLKDEKLSAELKMQYDIRQKALKLTANSMYGCLGFENSRFYCRPLAALITRFGRNILMKTKDLVESKKIEVIYGDTDSIMINTNVNDYEQVIKLGNSLKSEVNKLYRNLEIGIDGVFKCLLLLKKKKYAALSIDGKNPKDGQLIVHQEIKGLDIVRRDWCVLARQIGEKIIGQILSGQSCDVVIQNINIILTEIADKMSKNQIDLTLYEISKQLNKNPEEYNDTNNQPHVSVAIRHNNDVANGKKIRSGDIVSYIICEDGTCNSATQRAYSKSEIEKKSMKVDTSYYLAQQIHPIVSRLCEPIEGVDSMHIASCLGLDPQLFKSKTSSHATSSISLLANTALTKQHQKLQAYLNEIERFKNCTPFTYTCANCKSESQWKELFFKNDQNEIECILDKCSSRDCNLKPNQCVAYVKNQLTRQLNFFIKQYYHLWIVCDDAMCAYRTKRQSSKFTLFKPNCIECDKYTTSLEYTHADLYNQMKYFKYIFDLDACKNVYKNDVLMSNAIATYTNDLSLQAFKDLKEFVCARIKRNTYGIVNLKNVFSSLQSQ